MKRYNESFTWQKQTTVIEPTTNEPQEHFLDHGLLWGDFSATSSIEGEAYGGLQSQTDATIRLRQWPQVSALDRLVHRRWNEVYVITGVYRGDNETVLSVTRFQADPQTDQ